MVYTTLVSMTKKNKLSRRLLRVKKFFLRNVILTRFIIFSFFSFIIFYFSFLVLSYLKNKGSFYYFDLARAFVFPSFSDFRVSERRVNFLILGKGGAGHEAPDLTDTMIFASLFLGEGSRKPNVTLISLPRDIWVSDLRTKLNSLYYWGNKKQENGGISLARVKTEEMLGIPIHYVIVVDFGVFREVIDLLGGVNVYVENFFEDKWYPIEGKENDDCGGDPLFRCRYKTVAFEKGWHNMDGETALEFVRSRKAEGDEGTDIARQRRQQQVIEAIKNALVNRRFLFSPTKVKTFLNLVLLNTETDIDAKAAFALARYAFLARVNIKKEILDERFLDNPPISPKYDNLYVFVPKEGNWKSVQMWVKEILDN